MTTRRLLLATGALATFGLAGFGYHARDEYIEVDSIVPRLYLAARLLMELGQP